MPLGLRILCFFLLPLLVLTCRPRGEQATVVVEETDSLAMVETDTAQVEPMAIKRPLPPPVPPGKFVYASFPSTSKGDVPFCAYLPPGWSAKDTTTYPLLIYLYGQGGTEFSFARVGKAHQINEWITDSMVTPMVIISVRGEEIISGEAWHKQKIQWYTSENETMLTSEAEGELRAYCRKTFRAGMTSDQIALEGHSRGATGTLYYAFKHPDKFSSFIANAFVSDYALSKLKNAAKRNKQTLQSFYPPKLRMEIGTADHWVTGYGRKGSAVLHKYLEDLKIPHEYDTLSGADHHYYYYWNLVHPEHHTNGLAHLRFHEKAWQKAESDSLPSQ